MSKYTTGELAKLCGVSVRTVQSYDSRNILVPAALSEGGRRLYSEEDLKKLKIICFLRDAGISINGIAELFADPHPEKVLSLLLDQQELALRDELLERQRKLDMVISIRRTMRGMETFSVESIGDIAHVLDQKKHLSRLRLLLLAVGIPLGVLQWTAVILWITHGFWPLFALWAALAVIYGLGASVYYFRHVAFLCPECHSVFKGRKKEAFFAYHTPTMRRLTCPRCGRRGMCSEVYDEKGGANNG